MILGVTAFYNKLLVQQPCKNPALDSFFFKKTPGCYRDLNNFHRINISLVKCICTSLQKLSKHSRSHTHVTISPNLTNFADTHSRSLVILFREIHLSYKRNLCRFREEISIETFFYIKISIFSTTKHFLLHFIFEGKPVTFIWHSSCFQNQVKVF